MTKFRDSYAVLGYETPVSIYFVLQADICKLGLATSSDP